MASVADARALLAALVADMEAATDSYRNSEGEQIARLIGRFEVQRFTQQARAFLAQPDGSGEALDVAIRYVRNNLAVWSDDDSGDPPGARQLAAAYRDIYQKVLNVLEGREPLDSAYRAAQTGEGT